MYSNTNRVVIRDVASTVPATNLAAAYPRTATTNISVGTTAHLMNFEGVGITCAKLYKEKDESKKKKSKGKEISCNHKLDDLKHPFINYDCEPGEKLNLCPRGKERDCLYVTGPSGAGKSYFCS